MQIIRQILNKNIGISFCLGIKKAVADGLQVGGSDVKAVAIADDVTFIGPPDGRAAAEATEEFVNLALRLV